MKEASLKGYILCGSNYMTFHKRQNYDDSKKISSCQGLGEGGINSWSTEDFSSGRTTVYDTITEKDPYSFDQTHRMYNTKTEP